MKLDLPYVPSPEERLETIFKLIKFKKGQKSIDLGSGDGRFVIAMAKAGLEAHGVELLEKYIRRSKRLVAEQGLEGKAFIRESDFWDEDLSKYDVITFYLMAEMMDDMEKKLSRELKPGTIVISNGFKIPGWKIWKEERFIYIYKKK